MSLALIEESAKEARRLAIAGSSLAVGDFRIKKLIAPLEQAGAKVTVFAQVAKAITELVDGKEADSATNLLNLSTLLNAILYTQGQSGADGDYRELESFATTCTSTRTTARVLKPLVIALTNTGSGRFELIKSAHENGTLNDLRLIDPAIQALGDSYPELAELVATGILPAYGPGIAPRLKASLDFKGHKADARKLRLLHQMDPAGMLALCKTALDDGSPEVKAAAIECLGQHEDCLPLVMEQTKSKNKLLRTAALEALAAQDRPEITQFFSELIQGKALDFLAGPFRAMRNRQVLKSLLNEAQRVFDLLMKGDEEQIPRFMEILDCLDARKEPEVHEFALACFAKVEKIITLKAAKNHSLAGPDIAVRLAGILQSIGTPQALNDILSKHDALPLPAFGIVLHSAACAWPPKKIFDAFSPLVGQKKSPAKEKFGELERFLAWSGLMTNSTTTAAKLPVLEPYMTWDPRWLDVALKADSVTLVCSFARPGHKAVLEYLVKQSEAEKSINLDTVIAALMRCGHPQMTDVLLNLITKKLKSQKYYHYEMQVIFARLQSLPKSDLPKLEAFAATLDEKFVDKYLEAIAPLRPSPPIA